ncbi:zinc-binding dehydrogenase [Cellulomonas sp. 179-A 9B4 NHS]|uniref:zinc-binding dehydrogenase n=1 Tax=Cellulomonas sp. 179-A 9B4 NHS TaxID=3142379 RepID=UPI00399F0751
MRRRGAAGAGRWSGAGVVGGIVGSLRARLLVTLRRTPPVGKARGGSEAVQHGWSPYDALPRRLDVGPPPSPSRGCGRRPPGPRTSWSAGTGAVRGVIDRTWPLAQAADAHAYVEAGHKAGTVLLLP